MILTGYHLFAITLISNKKFHLHVKQITWEYINKPREVVTPHYSSWSRVFRFDTGKHFVFIIFTQILIIYLHHHCKQLLDGDMICAGRNTATSTEQCANIVLYTEAVYKARLNLRYRNKKMKGGSSPRKTSHENIKKRLILDCWTAAGTIMLKDSNGHVINITTDVQLSVSGHAWTV